LRIKETALRTTVDLADDVLFAVKELAKREKKSLGQVLSELSRVAFAAAAAAGTYPANQPAPSQGEQSRLKVSERIASYGIHPLPARGGLVSNELIDRLREAEGI
jgi:hypothetical protein